MKPTFKAYCEFREATTAARHLATGGVVGMPRRSPQEETQARAQRVYHYIIDVVKAHMPFAKNPNVMRAAEELRQAMEQS